MKGVARILIVIFFVVFVIGTFAASTSGFGVSGIQNQETMSQIKKTALTIIRTEMAIVSGDHTEVIF